MRHVGLSPAELVREHLKRDLSGVAVSLPVAFFVLVDGSHVAQTGAKRHIGEVVLHIRGMDNIRTGAIIRVGTAVTSALGNFGDQRLVVIDIPYNSSWVVGAER